MARQHGPQSLFQYYISSIETKTATSEWLHFLNFQYYISSIETYIQEVGCTCSIVFQYYISSIETNTQEKNQSRRLNFQYYISSIETWSGSSPGAYSASFNTTLVRLKLFCLSL